MPATLIDLAREQPKGGSRMFIRRLARTFVARYQAKFGASPQNYALTAYDAVLVLDDTIRRLVNDGTPITRDNVRDYAQATSLPTLAGTISLANHGDLKDQV